MNKQESVLDPPVLSRDRGLADSAAAVFMCSDKFEVAEHIHSEKP